MNFATEEIKNKLLKALVSGGEFNNRKFEGVYNNGHSFHAAERQILTYIVRKALNIVRLPYQYEFLIEKSNFKEITVKDLDEAVAEAKRLYDHTQKEYIKHFSKSNISEIKLRRGIGGVEAAVLYRLKQLISNSKDSVDFYFPIVTFFNYRTAAFRRDLTVKIDCPIKWIWISSYTVKELSKYRTDDEVWVVCDDPMGTLKIPLQNIEICNPNLSLSSYQSIMNEEDYEKVLSNLIMGGLGKANRLNRKTLHYDPGCLEDKLASIGRYLDCKLSKLNKSIRRGKVKVSENEY